MTSLLRKDHETKPGHHHGHIKEARKDMNELMKFFKIKIALALQSYFRNYKVLEQMIDREHDTFEEIRLKKLIGSTFRKHPNDRT